MKRSAAPTQRHSKRTNQASAQSFPRHDPLPVTSLCSQGPSNTNAAIDYSQPFEQFSVTYARLSNRKHIRWEGDGVLSKQHNILVLEDVNNGRKRLGASYNNNKIEMEFLSPGIMLIVGGYQVEIQNAISPPKCVNCTTFCALSDLQTLLYEKLQDLITLDEPTTQDFLNRLYCHPAVLFQRLQQFFTLDSKAIPIQRLLDTFPPGYNTTTCYVNESGKLQKLVQMISTFDANHEYAVIAASSKAILDIIGSMLEALDFTIYRIDGQPTSIKTTIFKRFNERDATSKVFLLHTGTSTCGYTINIATKLVLFDVESWSSELNVVDRVWRDTQAEECEVYRIVTRGSFEQEAYNLQFGDSQIVID